MHFSRTFYGTLTAASLLALAACGGGSDAGETLDLSNDRGSIVRNPPTQLASLSNVQFSGSLRASGASGLQLLALTGVEPTAGNVKCGIDVRYLQYGTVGGAAEKTNATGALILPTGGAGCTGARPIVLYAHGTAFDKNYNMALVSTNSEAALVAATFAAKGYIVVAPNYAGYEASKLGYHPYLNADQQSKDMIDALTAARKAIARIGNGTSDSGRLFVTGYSAGGHVAMATARALQAAGTPVTALAGGSGPYAMSAFTDDIFSGQPLVGGTLFTPLLSTSWQRSYGNIYTQPSELYTDAYASGIETLMPSLLTVTQLFTPPGANLAPKLPQAAMFGNDLPGFNAADPKYASLFGDPATALINTGYGIAVQNDKATNPCPRTTGPTGPLDCTPAHPLRAAAKLNDLRTWTPGAATLRVLLCGGIEDPTVDFRNTTRTAQYLSDQGAAQVLTLDLATASGGAADPFAGAKLGFQATINGIGAIGTVARAQNYHATVAPFCLAAAEGVFSGVLTALGGS